MARKILLADDSVTAQNMGRKILADAGYEVITVNNGSAALKKIGELRPDLIVLDVYMPGYSGLEVCQRLKEVGDTSHIPVLLTVGKLEPFKPEEAKRVRADGFIVKPFEASELLSALSKMEDKIVPRNESAKPGRFGRIAAAEEGRFDKTMSVEEDSGWKNRIAFPTKKKEKEKEPEPEERVARTTPKGTRSVIEEMRVEPSPVQRSEEKVDVGALATAGLPKDVTPEEIAALAAAAARVKGKIAEEKKEASVSDVAVVSALECSKQEQPAMMPEQKIEEKINSEFTEAASAIANLEEKPEAESVTTAVGPLTHEAVVAESEPVTMAVAAAVGESSSHASRWTAVSIALAPEDAGISLEEEMQKAYASFAAAENGHSSSITADSLDLSPAMPDALTSVPATVAPEAVQTLTAVASAAAEAVTAAVKELENVASAYAAQAPAAEALLAPSERPAVPVVETPAIKPEPTPEATAPAIESAKTSHSDATQQRVEELKEQVEPEQVPASSPIFVEKSPATEVVPEVAVAVSTEASSQSSSAPSAMQGSSLDSESSAPRDIAAMAAAVGGKVVEEAGLSDSDAAIASIVDGVLANLRPKIVEEISRKLGKK